MNTNTGADSAQLNTAEYMADRKGRLVPLNAVSEHDIEMDAFVKANIEKAKELQNTMREFKRAIFGDCHAFIALLDEKYSVKRGGARGNVTFTSYDGKYQISLKVADQLSFGPELQSAKSLIDECVKDWSEGSNENIRAIVDDAFDIDREGDLNTGRILTLRRIKINDERWIQAMEAISDSIIVTDTTAYINFRERDDDGKLQHITLDMAAL